MIKNAIFFAFLTLSSSYAQSIEEIVKYALNNNYDLKSMQNSILIANEQIKISKKWENPSLTLGANDIQSSDIFAKDLEPMQARYIGFSQVIPLGDKYKINENLTKKQKDIEILSLEDKKLELSSKIYEYAYAILVLQRKNLLLNKYENNLNSLKKLLNALYENSKVNQNSILDIDIKAAQLSLKQQNLQNTIKTLYLKLEEISYMKISTINANMNLEKKELKKEISSHPKILIALKSIEKSKTNSKLQDAKRNSDLKLNLAYFSRDEKYKDYVNFSVNIPLSIYGRENIKVLKSKFETKKLQDDLKKIEQKFKISIKILQNNINNSYTTYSLLQKTIIPLKQKIQMNIEIYNSLDQSQAQDSIKNLNEVISYELLALDEMNKYFNFISKSIYFTQGLK